MLACRIADDACADDDRGPGAEPTGRGERQVSGHDQRGGSAEAAGDDGRDSECREAEEDVERQQTATCVRPGACCGGAAAA
jgi:hypothetical protein